MEMAWERASDWNSVKFIFLCWSWPLRWHITQVISLFPKPSAVCCVPAILDGNKTGPVSSTKTIEVMFAGINMFWPLLRLILARVTSEKGPWNIYAQEQSLLLLSVWITEKKKWQQNSVNNFFFTNDARKWREKWRFLDFDCLHTLADCLIVTFHWSISISPLKLLSIGKSGFKSQNLDLRIFNRRQNLKTDFVADFIYWNPPLHGSPLSVIREKIPFRDFVFDWKSEDLDFKI